VEALVDPFQYGFMQRALAEIVLMGVACGLLGSFVVLRGLTYTGESLSHTLVPGAAIALVAGFSVPAGALAAGLVAVVAVALLLRRPDVGEETAVAVVFSGAFAAGVILLSARGTPRDLESILFGNILAVDAGDLRLGLAATLAVVALCAALGRRFVAVAFDRSFADAAGLRTSLLDVVLLVALACALTVALRGVGTLLVLALLVAPPATARVLTGRIWSMLWLAPLLAVGAGFAGLELSYHAGVAAGPAIALIAVVGFAAAASVGALRSRLRPGPMLPR
jgi:ABC-type Mn2+/Zn2+ transport system permease subunit